MLEQETHSSLHYTESNLLIEQELSANLGFDIELGESLSFFEDPRLDLMHSNEREFSRLLLSKALIVFPEPNISVIDYTPDFFVYNPRTFQARSPYFGKFVELTLFKDEELNGETTFGRRKFARKRRQKAAFEECGIPIVYICREQQENIKRMQDWPELF